MSEVNDILKKVTASIEEATGKFLAVTFFRISFTSDIKGPYLTSAARAFSSELMVSGLMKVTASIEEATGKFNAKAEDALNEAQKSGRLSEETKAEITCWPIDSTTCFALASGIWATCCSSSPIAAFRVQRESRRRTQRGAEVRQAVRRNKGSR
jgi:hypothetical protein